MLQLSIYTVPTFTKLYNQKKQETSSLGKYAKPTAFNDKTSTGLESLIKAYFRYYGIKAWKVDVKGTYRQLKNGKFAMTPTNADKGVADMFTVIRGVYLAIEVKIGDDKQSSKQIQFEIDVIQQGGKYMIVNSFYDFQVKLHKLIYNGHISNEVFLQ